MKGDPEAIFDALFQQVCAINTEATPLATMSRRWRKWDETGIIFPAFYQMQVPGIDTLQEQTPRGFGAQKYRLKALLFFYFEVDIGDTTTPTSPVLNAYYKAVEKILEPAMISVITQPGLPHLANQASRQQLGGRVGIEHCYIDGMVQMDEGLVNPPAMLVFPITIVTG